MDQSDRIAVKRLLYAEGREDLRIYVGRVWEDLPSEERTHENCFRKLLILYPESMAPEYKPIILEDEWGDGDY